MRPPDALGWLHASLLGNVMDYLTMEGILVASRTAKVFLAAISHVSHFLTYDSRGVSSHPDVWRKFSGARRIVVRSCPSAKAFEDLLVQIFKDDAACTKSWKEFHVGVPGDVFEDVAGGEEGLSVGRLRIVLEALQAGKLASIEDLDIYSTDTLAWDEAPDDQILAPFEYATEGVRKAMTEILLALPPRVGLRSGLHWGALDLCGQILRAHPGLDVEETTPYMDPVLVMWAHSLQFGSRPKHLDLLREILATKKVVDLDKHGPLTRQTPLCVAAYYLEVDCVEALLKLGADPNAGDIPPLLVCAGLHARDVLDRVYLGAAGPVFVDENDFWERRRRDDRLYDDYAPERDYDAHMVSTPRAYRRLFILRQLVQTNRVSLARKYKGLSAMNVLTNDVRHYTQAQLHAALHTQNDPLSIQLIQVILAELHKMIDILSDALILSSSSTTLRG